MICSLCKTKSNSKHIIDIDPGFIHYCDLCKGETDFGGRHIVCDRCLHKIIFTMSKIGDK